MTPGQPQSSLPQRLREEGCIALTSFGYFSRLPLARGVGFSTERLAASGRYLPLVGLVIGGLGALVYIVAMHRLSPGVAVLLSMITTLLASGALHEDGLADCCDGFGGAYEKEDVLRIMKDSRIGAYGAIGLIMSLGLKWQTLSALAVVTPIGAAWTMVSAHAASRAMAIVLTRTLHYVRSNGKAQAFGQPAWGSVGIALLIGLPLLLWHGAAMGIAQIVLLFLLLFLLHRWFVRRLGGYTGDCLGFAQQCSEISLYLIVLAWI